MCCPGPWAEVNQDSREQGCLTAARIRKDSGDIMEDACAGEERSGTAGGMGSPKGRMMLARLTTPGAAVPLKTSLGLCTSPGPPSMPSSVITKGQVVLGPCWAQGDT